MYVCMLQGCDERNISAVVYTKEATRALRAVHSAFWLSSMQVSIGVIGGTLLSSNTYYFPP